MRGPALHRGLRGSTGGLVTGVLTALTSASAQGQPALDVPAEAEVRHAIGLRLGVRVTSAREDLLVPLTFSGAGPALGANYRGVLGPGTLEVALDLGGSVVANRFGHLGATVNHALRVGYLIPLPSDGAWHVGLGAMIGEDTDVLAIESWDDSHRYWLALDWVGPMARLDGPLSERWRLEATASFAVAGAAGRPEAFRRNKQEPTDRVSFYLFHPHAELSAFGPWDVQHLRVDVAVRPSRRGDRVGSGWSFGVQGRLSRADFPGTIVILEAVPYVAGAWGVR